MLGVELLRAARDRVDDAVREREPADDEPAVSGTAGRGIVCRGPKGGEARARRGVEGGCVTVGRGDRRGECGMATAGCCRYWLDVLCDDGRRGVLLGAGAAPRARYDDERGERDGADGESDGGGSRRDADCFGDVEQRVSQLRPARGAAADPMLGAGGVGAARARKHERRGMWGEAERVGAV